MQTAPARKEITQPKPLPAPNSDFYQLVEVLNAEELAVVRDVRAFMESKVAPVINKYWAEDAFPFELLPGLKELNIGGLGLAGYGCKGGSQKLFGMVAMELARVDASFATFYGVHDGLAMGSIYIAGSEEQKRKWLPPMARMEKIGCFGLTEPTGLRNRRRVDHDRETRGRHLGPQRPEEVDRKLDVVRCIDHLGARRRRQSGQGLYRREQDVARLQC
jgi:glutaryl-CoA dehydrogenase